MKNGRTPPPSVNKTICKSEKNVRPRFIMLGGFLGAGKTTTLLRLALSLQRKGLRVGLITNDQAQGLVDSALAEELDLPVREIAGGCFCCRSESLVEALDRLSTDAQPEVFLAEPVGSCTDLVATVSLPLEQIYKKGFVMAPYAVVVDPYRAMQSLGVEGEPLFSSDVNYIYRKQLEEAEVIAINKVDVISARRLAALRAALELEYPQARIFEIASRQGQGLEGLFELLSTEAGQTRRVMEIDYVRYGVGEALLGWVNLRAGLTMTGDWDPDAWLMTLVNAVAAPLKKQKMEVAHFKVSLKGVEAGGIADKGGEPGERGKTAKGPKKKGTGITDGGGKDRKEVTRGLAAVQWTGAGTKPTFTRKLEVTALPSAELLLNLRAEADPDKLAACVLKVLAKLSGKTPGMNIMSVRMAHFRPGQPVPTHRVEK